MAFCHTRTGEGRGVPPNCPQVFPAILPPDCDRNRRRPSTSKRPGSATAPSSRSATISTSTFPRGASLSSLTAATIHDALKDLTPSQQAHAPPLFKAFLNWCVNERQYLHKSPLFGLKSPYRRTSRERTLSDAEIAQILAATTDDGQFNNLVQFLIYSAQRRTQVSKLQRTYCNYAEKTITWPKEDMKSNQQHMIPLTPKLQALIERTDYLCVFGPTPYQAWSRGKAELDRRVKLPHWTLHDLRRTARTNLARLGVQENIAERLLPTPRPN